MSKPKPCSNCEKMIHSAEEAAAHSCLKDNGSTHYLSKGWFDSSVFPENAGHAQEVGDAPAPVRIQTYTPTRRDAFAMAALSGMLSNPETFGREIGCTTIRRTASRAKRFADATIAELDAEG